MSTVEALGGFTARDRPAFGLRPTVQFTFSVLGTIGWVGFSIWVSDAWRSDLEEAIGPVAAWVIPVILAYIPGVVIGFLCFTLLLTRYRAPRMDAPVGPWPDGYWPAVTVIVAAYNEEDAIASTLEQLALSSYEGRVETMLADNNSTDRTAEIAEFAALQLGLNFRRIFEPVAGKHHALNTALGEVTTKLMVTVDADTLLHRDALTYLVARVVSRPQDQHVCATAGRSCRGVGAAFVRDPVRDERAFLGGAGRERARGGRAGRGGRLLRGLGARAREYEGSAPLGSLYPGDADWVAVDGYNWGALRAWGWQSYADVLAPTVQTLGALAPGVPVMIAEIGCAPDRRKPAWITDALDSAAADGVDAVVWFEYDKETDWRLAENAATARAAAPCSRPGPGGRAAT